MNLHDYSAIIISISGGKDSQTILGVMMRMASEQQYAGQIVAIHADTKAEWPESLPHCQMLCNHYGIELRVAEPHRPLPEHIERRCMAMMGTGKIGWPSARIRDCTGACKRNPIQKVIRAGWPSAACRFCQSDCKRNPIFKVTRNAWPAKLNAVRLLSVTGERRQESSNRAKLAELEPHKALTAGGREVWSYRPILDYKLESVWAHIAATGLPRHIAYDRGNERLSCAICMLAKDGDIRNGAIARPDVAEHYLRIERETGQLFRHKQSLASILTTDH